MDLISFATDVIDTLGGITEPLPNGAAAVLLPGPVAADLGLPEEGRLVSDPATEAATDRQVLLVSYGSDALDKLVRAATGPHGRATMLRVEAEPPSSQVAEAAVTKTLQPSNGVVRIVDSEPAVVTYMLVSFHYTAAGDERREGLVDVALTTDGLSSAPSLPDALLSGLVGLSEAPCPDDAELTTRAITRAAAVARLATLEALAPVRQVLANRLARGVERMHRYYRAMQEETLRAGYRRARDREAERKLLERVNAIPIELQHRITEQRARLALRVNVRPLTAILVTMPVVNVRLRLLRRKTERQITLPYGSLQRAIDVPLCDGCGARPVTTPVLCDDHAHVLCDDCMWTCPACGVRTCLACARRCRRCREPVSASKDAATVAVDRMSPLAEAAAQPEVASRPASPRHRPDARASVRASAAACTNSETDRVAERVRAVLAEAKELSSAHIAERAVLSVDVTRHALKILRARGEVGLVGVGRGARYRLL